MLDKGGLFGDPRPRQDTAFLSSSSCVPQHEALDNNIRQDNKYTLHLTETKNSLFEGPRHLRQSKPAGVVTGDAALERLLRL